jgi:bifunctional oligoribonuclease and PAP phosphatase NrnA
MTFYTIAGDKTSRLKKLVEHARKIVILAHHNPDGDAMGSSLGLARVLQALRKDVTVIMPNTPAPYLHWMPGAEHVVAFESKKEEALDAIADSELLFCLDFNRPDRVRDLEQPIRNARTKVVIDHHQDPEDFADILISEVHASSTCQLVYDVLVEMGWKDLIDTDAATCLYTGMVTDSGSFRYRNTTSHTMRVAAELMDRGVEIDQVHGSIMDDNSVERLKLLGFTLNERMEVHEDLKAVVLWLTKDDLDRFNYKPGDTEGFVNYGLSIAGIRISAFFMERAEGIKISVRSKGSLAVDKLMKEHFEGGGHINASGGQTKEPMRASIDRFLGVLPALLEQHP